jgi:hypothetical protein
LVQVFHCVARRPTELLEKSFFQFLAFPVRARYENDRSQDIRDRTFAFACRVARLCLDLTTRPGTRRISLREARETVYWLRIFLALQLGPKREVQDLRGEANK